MRNTRYTARSAHYRPPQPPDSHRWIARGCAGHGHRHCDRALHAARGPRLDDDPSTCIGQLRAKPRPGRVWPRLRQWL